MAPTLSPVLRSLWTIVLAAGEGTRLRPLTRALYGEDLPKQFAKLQGRRSLLQATIDRARRWSSPDKTVVVVAAERENLARAQAARFGDIDLVVQPKNIGTGPGVLLPLSRIAARDPDAIVAIVPSDHYVRDAESFVNSVKRAEAIARAADAVVLVAAVPEGAETQYGWIVPARPETEGGSPVAAFVEKPNARTAGDLFAAGALWNTFIMVGTARAFWELCREHLVHQTRAFEAYQAALGMACERSVLSSLYEHMAPGDFSKDVLEKTTSLRVTSLAPCGWSDWGTPERVFVSLRGTRDHGRLLERMHARVRSSKERFTRDGQGLSRTPDERVGA